MCVKVTRSRDHYQSVFLISYYMYMQHTIESDQVSFVSTGDQSRPSPIQAKSLSIEL